MVIFFAVWIGILCTAVPLRQRWAEEKQDRRLALAADWNEFRDFNVRLSLTTAQMLAELHSRGLSSLVVSPVTLNDLWLQRRIQPLGDSKGTESLDVARIRFMEPSLARQLAAQWSWRNIPGLQIQEDGKTVIVSRRQGSFLALKDADLGFDPLLITQVRAAGLTPVLRIYDDPWLSDDQLKAWLTALPAAAPHLGVLFSSDEIPGGKVQSAVWRSWMKHTNAVQFLPEFHPSRAAWFMAYGLPAHAYRAHSIPAAELRDLKLASQLSRWHRAVEERSCRLLLLRMGPNDSRLSYLQTIEDVAARVTRHHWTVSFPTPRSTWRSPTGVQRWVNPMLAFAVICLAPCIALRGAKAVLPRWRSCFFRIVLGCFIGALIAAAVAQTPYTRLSIVPFRGVKWAFLFSWALTLLTLYDGKELRWTLYQYVRRRDIVLGAVGLAVLGYLIVRTGNAPAAFKIGWEQSVRDALEAALVARPRFKEFAIGYPALWVGCFLQALYRQRRTDWDGRWLMVIGMMGPISMINTFCHLHSPLVLELWRSFNGLVAGVFIGSVIVFVIRRWLLSRPQITLPFAEGDALFYQRTS